MPRHVGWVSSVLATWVVAAFAVAIPAGAQPARLEPLSPPRKVKVATVNQISDGGIYAAIENGYFAALGLDVDLVVFQSAANMIGPLGTGELDVGGGATAAGLWNAELRNIGIRAVADKGSSRAGWGFVALVTKPDSSIKSCADLEGKRLSAPSESNSLVVSLDAFLGKCGLGVKQVDLKAMGFPQVPTAIANGALDAGLLSEPLLTLSQQKGLVAILARGDEMRPVEQVALILYSEKFRRETAAANRFMVAYVRGIRDYLAAYANGRPPADWLIDVLAKHTAVKDRALYKDIVPAGLDPWGRMNLDALAQDFAWFKRERIIVSDTVKLEDAIDQSFLDFAKGYIEAHHAAQ